MICIAIAQLVTFRCSGLLGPVVLGCSILYPRGMPFVFLDCLRSCWGHGSCVSHRPRSSCPHRSLIDAKRALWVTSAIFCLRLSLEASLALRFPLSIVCLCSKRRIVCTNCWICSTFAGARLFSYVVVNRLRRRCHIVRWGLCCRASLEVGPHCHMVRVYPLAHAGRTLCFGVPSNHATNEESMCLSIMWSFGPGLSASHILCAFVGLLGFRTAFWYHS